MSVTVPIQNIPLHQLALSPLNVRQVPASAAEDAELKASIRARGILQNLLVHASPQTDGVFLVHGGGRRLKMLQELAGEQIIAEDYPVPCLVAAPESAQEISLAENTARAAMHPADEFAAMAALIDAGESIAGVATRFGVSERSVRQRLRLGKLAPEILGAFRAGDVTLEIVTAFTLGADIEAQRVVWQQVKDDRFPSSYRIRRLLTESAIPMDSGLGLFVGIEAYERAGGSVTRDLFSEDDEGFLEDAALVRRLALEKLETKAAELRQDWAWATAELDLEYGFTAQYDRIEPQPPEFSDEVLAELATIEVRQRALDELPEDEWDEVITAEAERIGERYDTLIETSEAERRFLPEDRARAGCIVTIGEDGEFSVYAGLVERSMADNAEADPVPYDDDAALGEQDPPSTPSPDQVTRKEFGYSRTLIDDLKAHRQQITRAHLAGAFPVAFDVALYAMCMDIFKHHPHQGSLSLKANEIYIRSSSNDLRDTPADRLLKAHAQKLERSWLALPADQRFTALAALPAKDKQRLFAWCVAATLEPQLGFEDRADPALERAGERLAIPFADCWRPTAANYWARVKKGYALKVGEEILGARWAKDHADDKKATLATALEAAFDPATNAHVIGVDAAARERAAMWLPAGFAYTGATASRQDDEAEFDEEADEAWSDGDAAVSFGEEPASDRDFELPAFLTEDDIAA